jgi:hypothetical protein
LANIYERQYRQMKDPVLFEASEQAIDRVLGNRLAGQKQKTEALALKGRNQETRWRLGFIDFDSVQERHKAALSPFILSSLRVIE